VLAPLSDGVVSVDWDQGKPIDLPVSDLETTGNEAGQFAELPAKASKAKSYAAWEKDLAAWLYRSQKLELLKSANLDAVSNPDESERDFRLRLQQAAREKRDAAVEKLRQKYAPKIAALEEKRRRAEQTVERESEQAKGQKMQTAISFGATLLQSFLGRKSLSAGTLGRATTAVRGVGRSMKESEDVGRAQETVTAVGQQLVALNDEFKKETETINQAFDAQTESLETIALKPKKADIAVKHLSLAWTPYWQGSQGELIPGWE
jgi:hypothetical protein